MRNIAIIPARSGSKGIPDKNIKCLAGKPLLYYTILAAKDSGVFDEIMVSTDSEKYAEIARSCGANVPFLRSSENAGDCSSSWDVMREVISKYQKKGDFFDTFCVLQPTSPLRRAESIVGAYEMYRQHDANSVVSVCEVGFPMNICNTLPKDHSLIGFLRTKDRYVPRQMTETFYRLNGAIYACNVDNFMKYNTVYNAKSYAYIMERSESIDIDDEDDWMLAEYFINRNMKKEK